MAEQDINLENDTNVALDDSHELTPCTLSSVRQNPNGLDILDLHLHDAKITRGSPTTITCVHVTCNPLTLPTTYTIVGTDISGHPIYCPTMHFCSGAYPGMVAFSS